MKVEELEPVFTAIGGDWIRFLPFGWILWTDKPAPHIYTLLIRYLDTDDGFLISPLKSPDKDDTFGLFPDWVWNWLNSKRLAGGPDFHFGDDFVAQLKLPKPK